MAFRLGVDVGGTFTDLLLFEDTSGAFWRHKTPSTPHDSSVGILTGLEAICGQANVHPSRIDVLLPGTTVTTNAVLEGEGARVGLVDSQQRVDLDATPRLRERLRADRPPLETFDRGGDIDTLRERCLADTGLAAPMQPVWSVAPWPTIVSGAIA